MQCPHCNKPTADIGKNCVHCGRALREETERSYSEPLVCPHCNIRTEIIVLSGVALDYCYRCSGIWFDRGEIKTFQNALMDKHLSDSMKSALRDLAVPSPHLNRPDYLHCPVCSQVMNHRTFAGVSGIVLDRCPIHGIWMEQTDLVEILEMIDSDNLEALLKKEKNRENRRLQERLRKIESKLVRLDWKVSHVDLRGRVHLMLDALGFL